jgi:hypothetical protein
MNVFGKKRYNAYTRPWTVGSVLHMLGDGQLILDAPYQRGHVWSQEQQERLIDSLASGLGIPPIYIRELDAGEQAWIEVIDGKQRITALQAFVRGEFAYKGHLYPDLPRSQQRFFEAIGFGALSLKEITDEEAWEVFRRVNFCGVPQDTLSFEERLHDYLAKKADQ